MAQKSTLERAGVLLVILSLVAVLLSHELNFRIGLYASAFTFLLGDALYLWGAAKRAARRAA